MPISAPGAPEPRRAWRAAQEASPDRFPRRVARAAGPFLAAATPPLRGGAGTRRAPKSGGGFTLVEILVVMLVLGIATALVSVRLVASERDRGLRFAQELAVSLEHAALAAEWRGRNILWRHQEAGWTFLIEERGEGGASWQPLRDESSLSPRGLPEGMRIVGFERAGQALAEPRLLFATHGINDPFSLSLALGEQVWRLSGDALGRVKVEPR